MNTFRLSLLTACFLALPAWGQGSLAFLTRFKAAGVDIPVRLGSVNGPAPGPDYSAALYLVESGGLSLIPNSLTTFREPFNGSTEVCYYVNGLQVVLPTVQPDVTVRMRAWLTAAGTYESAPDAARGESGDMQVRLGFSPGVPGDLPSSAQGFVIGQGHEFTGTVNGVGGYPAGFVFVPEPTVLTLAALGAFGFWVVRRRSPR